MNVDPWIELVNNGANNQTIKQSMNVPAVLISKKEQEKSVNNNNS